MGHRHRPVERKLLCPPGQLWREVGKKAPGRVKWKKLCLEGMWEGERVACCLLCCLFL